jgi:hypothetical protein
MASLLVLDGFVLDGSVGSEIQKKDRRIRTPRLTASAFQIRAGSVQAGES